MQESLTLRASLSDPYQKGAVQYLRAKDGTIRFTFQGPFRGLDTTSNLASIIPSYFVQADNVNILESGAASKRAGYTGVLATPWGSRNIRQGYEFKYGTGGTNAVCLYGHTAAGSSGIFGRINGSGGVDTIVSSLSETARPSLVQFKDLLFFYNGTDDFVYDGTNTRQIGITPPASAPALASNVNGSLTAGATYFFAYTYYNSVTGAESSPSPLASVTIAANPNDGVTATVVAGDSTTADTIRLYRTVANLPVLYLDTTDVISSTSIQSTQADAGLGMELELDNTRLSVYGQFKYAEVIGTRVAVTGDDDIPNRVHFSAIGQEGPKPESFRTHQFVDCESSKGRRDANVGIRSANEFPIVLKKESVGRIEQVGANDVSRADDPAIFQYKELSGAVTSISHFASCNVFGELVWLGKDNVFATDGTQVRPVADSISNTIKTFSFEDPDELTGFNDKNNRRVIFTIKSDSTKTEPDWALVGSYVNYPEFFWTIYKNYGFGCMFDVPSQSRVYAGNLTLNGDVYNLNIGDNDDGAAIAWKLVTAPMHFGLPEEEKLYTLDMIDALGDGSSYNLTAYSIYNYSGIQSETGLLDLDQGAALWDAVNWDAFNWVSGTPGTLRHFCHTKAFSKQLVLENNNADEPITIFGYSIIARPTSFK